MAVLTCDSVVPNSGSGFSQTFVFKYSDSLGAIDIATAWVWFTDSFTTSQEGAAGTPMIKYDRALNTLQVLSDNGSLFGPAAVVGSGVTLQNRSCVLNVANCAAVIAGTLLTLTLDLTFTGTFVGGKNVWLYVDNTGTVDNSGWQQRGAWTIPLPLIPAAVGANWVKGSTVVSGALRLIGVLGQGGSPTAPQMSEGMRRLNMMMGQWFLENQTSPFISRGVFPLVANKQTYSVGNGGEIDTPRVLKLDGLGLLLNGNVPTATLQQRVEIPRAILTDDAWRNIQIKQLPNAMFTAGYYNPTYAAGFGTLDLWPVPNNNFHSIVLYTRAALPLFVSETTQYDLPEGAEEAMEYNLAIRLAAPNTVPVPPDVAALARSSLASFKRSNTRFNDIPIDPMFASSGRRGRYNINTGTGG